MLFATPGLGCGPTLARGPEGWHEDHFNYFVTPLDDGNLFTAGWRLDNYKPTDGGFRRGLQQDDRTHLKLLRAQDDGALYLTSYPIAPEDQEKLPEVLADRWLDRIVRTPQTSDTDVTMFAPVVSRRVITATTQVGLRTFTAESVVGRSVTCDKRETFDVPRGHGAELTCSLAPPGSDVDRLLYLAVIKNEGGSLFALVVYGNTPTVFDAGLPDATSFAHRVHF
jgi:hypothetical protein